MSRPEYPQDVILRFPYPDTDTDTDTYDNDVNIMKSFIANELSAIFDIFKVRAPSYNTK